MGYTEFNPTVKKVNLKPKGEVEIVLTSSLGDLRGSIETLSEMIDQKVRVALESTVVTYNVQINARTDRPIKSYRVDEHGVVSEIKPEGEQVELDLGVPKLEDPIKDVPEEISREVVDDFILALLAPDYPDLPYPFLVWVGRLREGETYSRLASEFGMSSGKIVELIDEYRSRVAPLAAKWDEWRQSQVEQPSDSDPIEGQEQAEDRSSDQESDTSDEYSAEGGEDIEMEDAIESDQITDVEDELSDWEQEILGGRDPEPVYESSDPVDIEQVILTQRPQFDDIPYDFPELLTRRRAGETWMNIAKSLDVASSKLAAAWRKYKERVREQFGGDAA